MAAIVEVEPIAGSCIRHRETGIFGAAGRWSAGFGSVPTHGPEAMRKPADNRVMPLTAGVSGTVPAADLCRPAGTVTAAGFSSGIDSKGCSDGGDCRG
jgi:hypothetical protein